MWAKARGIANLEVTGISGLSATSLWLNTNNPKVASLKDPKIRRVASSVESLGHITLDVVFAPKKFVDANPKTTQAFIAALDDANAFIARDKPGAAAIYARLSKVKVSEAEVVEMLNDPDTQFSTTPVSVMDFADFMHLAGTIKTKPATWKDLFVVPLHARPGS